MQAVLCPVVGRLSDVVDRKYLSSILLTIAFAGCVSWTDSSEDIPFL